jgi:AcrR family transcriptional regulator
VLTHILPDDMNEHSLRLRDRDETRRRLVDAAERVLRAKGLARATTKEIAREAGLAEGTLYLHFADKLDLIRAVQEKLLPPFIELLLQLPARAGTRTVEANLTEVAEQALVLYRDLLLVGSGLFADPELLERFRVRMRELGGGPHKAYGPIVAYL